MKYDWKKAEKQFYLPKAKPEVIDVPKFKFFTIEGQGNPNDPFFSEYIGVLYSLAYAIRMSPKQNIAPEGFFEYTVYPLEGIWDLVDYGKYMEGGELDKNNLKFNLMIRQPEFVTNEYALETIECTMVKKPHQLLNKVKFEEIEDGKCIQMLHIGSYDSEPESFRLMEKFAQENNLIRIGHTHREIYMSDFRRVTPEKLKTVLRFRVNHLIL
jgi:hypothetical protein